MSIAIKVENLSKAYQIGQIGTGTISRDLERWWTTKVMGKEDPFLKIGKANDLSTKEKSNVVWSLKDINFEIQQGEAVGIIGKNGAGKSTLLKLLSRVTSPTTGKIKIKGRVASLLEVGTGFHPELTGKENIYLNGSILGMRKKEISSKLDEIIDFSGVERYIDTPVKRYSSGMYVRLAFAVAAHLDTEIMIVDEVLAVGDAEFQKRCLGKMNDVSSKDGRTVLFVSHNMTAVQSLCTEAISLINGKIHQIGNVSTVINDYLSKNANDQLEKVWGDSDPAPENEFVKIESIKIVPQFLNGNKVIDVRTPLDIYFEFWNLKDDQKINLSFHLYNLKGDCIMNLGSPPTFLQQGLAKGKLSIPGNFLNDDSYYLTTMIVKDGSKVIYNLEEAISFTVEDYRGEAVWHGKWAGAVRPTFMNFSLEQDTAKL